MSKSRTGRKGRVRLAVAASLGDIDNAVGDATIVDANGRLGASSGFLSSDSDLTNAQIQAYIQKQLHKPGTANALFQQGEVVGPLGDSVDTQNNASGAWTTDAGSGTYQNVTGETSAALLAPLSSSPTGKFAHYVLPAASQDTTDAGAINKAAGDGGDLGGTSAVEKLATASTSQIVATEVRGVCYHPGGPGSDFVPIRDLGVSSSGSNVVAASQIVINPSMADIWADTGVTDPQNVRVELHGDMVNGSAGTAGAGGDSIFYYTTPNDPAIAKIKFLHNASGSASANAFGVGHEMKIRNGSGEVILTIIGKATGTEAGVCVLAASSGAVTNQSNVDWTSGASEKKLFVIAPRSPVGSGNVAYDGGSGDTATDGVGQFVAALVAGINGISASQGLGIKAAASSAANDKDQLEITYNLARGAAGNNANSASNDVSQTSESALSVAAYSSSGQLLVPTAATHAYFGDIANTAGGGANAASAIIGFAGGATGDNFNTAVTRVSTTTLGSQVNVNIHDLPIRVGVSIDDAARDTLSSGVPQDTSAGFVIVWGTV